MTKIAVLGAGSWGTALSLLLARKGYDISLWVWDEKQADGMQESRLTPFMPGFTLPENIGIARSVAEAVEGANYVLFVTISSAASATAEELGKCVQASVPIITATKGLSKETGLTISQTLAEVLGDRNPIAAISGPNLAIEVAKGVPTATVAACTDEAVAREVQNLFMCPSLRVYTNTDVVGVELAGALKNVIAIAAGISDGLGFGDNTKAALLTRGLAEITRLGVRIGARQATFMGLAGVGDLMATCASPLSRNRRVGLGLGSGRKLDDIVSEIGQVAEGVPTTRAAYALAERLSVPMPIVDEIYSILFHNKPPKEVVTALMAREPKDEVW